MPIEIKTLLAGDEDVLANVAEDVFDHDVNPSAASKFLADPRHHIAVAVDDGKVVGFASGVHYFHPDKPVPELFVNEVGVAPSHQGRGLGKAVVTALLEAGHELGCGQAWVLTDRENIAAMRLYAACGAKEAPTDQVMFGFALGPRRAGADTP
jgi:ribosomal protein S18 acetylase RimI-like enzyme